MPIAGIEFITKGIEVFYLGKESVNIFRIQK
jgi:hypothetical protein